MAVGYFLSLMLTRYICMFCSKNVLFGKVLSGSALLKKIEGAGTEKGKPLYMVKIVDCGEVSAGKIQVAARKDKGMI